jgi:RNA polymerase sigma-70 factor (ECF subfamily)
MPRHAARFIRDHMRPAKASDTAAYREALMLTDLGDLSQVDAARRVGLSVPGMKARVQRARSQVRELLGECCEVALDPSRRVADVRRTGRCA